MREIDGEILKHLQQGNSTPSGIAKALGVTQVYVLQRLQALMDMKVIERIDRGIYRPIKGAKEN